MKKFLPLLLACLLITGCKARTIAIDHDPKQDAFVTASQLLNNNQVDYEPKPEKTHIVILTLKPDGTGQLREEHMYDFTQLTLTCQPGEKVILSLPQPKGGSLAEWQLLLNEYKTTSQAFTPEVLAPKQASYDRINYLLEPTHNATLTAEEYDKDGQRIMSFRLDFTGLPAEAPDPSSQSN